MRIFSRRRGRHGLPGSYSGWSATARLVAEREPKPINLRPAPARSPHLDPQETAQ
ncbi:hypothetical protein AB0395_47545 [Streptosporangium sp. NPDC051023]|uniref:hypothetical protein n=1 Tax=Streptosporangium sp. NPDC051023 TaxID=3155410 RepID=UPI00344D77F4